MLFLYLFTTFLAAVVAVLTSRLFPQTLSLGKAAKADVVPQGLSEVIQTLLTNIVANPIQAIIDGNYICILMWACLFGLAMKSIANESSKAFMANVADAVSQVIRWVINLAPFGIMGLVFTNVADNGLSAFTKYGSLLLLLVALEGSLVAALAAAQRGIDFCQSLLRVRLSQRVRDQLVANPWPGNVRELEHAVERMVALATGPVIDELEDGPVPARSGDEAGGLKERLAAFERTILEEELAACDGNHSELARRLDLSRATLLDKLKRYGLR